MPKTNNVPRGSCTSDPDFDISNPYPTTGNCNESLRDLKETGDKFLDMMDHEGCTYYPCGEVTVTMREKTHRYTGYPSYSIMLRSVVLGIIETIVDIEEGGLHERVLASFDPFSGFLGTTDNLEDAKELIFSYYRNTADDYCKAKERALLPK